MKVGIVESTIGEIQLRGENIQELSLKHAKMTTSTLTREVGRLEKILSTLENYQQGQIDSLKKTVQLLEMAQEGSSDFKPNILA